MLSDGRHIDYVYYTFLFVENPCLDESGRDIHVCGKNGNCGFTINPDKVSLLHTCRCLEGYENTNGTCAMSKILSFIKENKFHEIVQRK